MADQNTPTGRYVLIGVLAGAALLIGLTNGRIIGLTVTANPPKPGTSASASGIATATAIAKPPLLQTPDFEFITPYLTGQDLQAATDIEDYWAGELTSGGTSDEADFIEWAVDQLGVEPTDAVRNTERAQVAAINQSARAQLATEWLSTHGCRDAWIGLVQDKSAGTVPGDDVAGPLRSELEAVLTFAAKVASAAQAKSDEKSAKATPCALRNEPVRSDCKCLYPSPEAAMSAAARVYLDARDASDTTLYRIMEKQVDTGMVYSGLELPSDIKAGAYLGYLAGHYYLTSNGYDDTLDSTATTPTP